MNRIRAALRALAGKPMVLKLPPGTDIITTDTIQVPPGLTIQGATWRARGPGPESHNVKFVDVTFDPQGSQGPASAGGEIG